MTSQFSKKTSMILMALSIIGLIAGTALVLFSNQLLPVILNFLERALHRTISIDRWISTLQSFFIIPVFIVIVFNAVVFFKYDDKTKTILIISVLAIIAVMIVIANYVGTQSQMHSDIAAEMMLWRECVIEKSLMPRGWGYSTELRILNTQIFGALFFAITNNWALVKTFVSVSYLIVLALATLFLLKQLGIEKLWIKLLCITFMVAPFSVETWEHIAFGNYYIPHLSISFCYVALALNLTNNTNKKTRGNQIKNILFIALAFLSSLSSIRYLIILIFPFYISVICYEFLKIKTQKIPFSAKQFFIENKLNFYGGVGFVAGCIGYLFNNVLHIFYTFYQYSAVRFNAIGDVKFVDIVKAVLNIFGHRENIAVFTPNGVANVFLHIALILFVILFIQTLKTETNENKKILFYFLGINFVFNTYVVMNSEFNFRFYIPVVYYIFPCVFSILSNNNFGNVKKYILCALWSVTLLVSSFSLIQGTVTGNRNADRKNVIEFLLENNYTFGYASYWNADVTECLSNGKINMACLALNTNENTTANFDYYDYGWHPWLSPKRYYEKDFKNDEKIFLLVTQDEFSQNAEKRIFTTGTQIYADDFYRVYQYENHDAFRNGF